MNIKYFPWFKLNPLWHFKRFKWILRNYWWDMKEYYDFNGVTIYFNDVECPETAYIPVSTVHGLDNNQIAYIALTKTFGGDIDDVMCESEEKDISKVIQNAADSIKKANVKLNMGDDTYTKFFRHKSKNRDCYIVDVTL